MAVTLAAPPQAPPKRTTTAGAQKTAMTEKQSQELAARQEEEKNKRIAFRASGINGIGQIAQFAAQMTGQLHDAGAISMHVPNVAHEAAVVAEDNEKFGKSLDRLAELGPYAALFAAALPLACQLAVNHRLLKAENMAPGSGVISPEQLTAEVRAQLAIAEAQRMEQLAYQKREALRRQKEAEASLAQYQDEVANGTPPLENGTYE